MQFEFRGRSAVAVLVAVLLTAPLAQPGLAHFSGSRSDRNTTQNTPGNQSIQIAKITATGGPNGVLIEWQTTFEINNLGFNVFRIRNGQTVQINRPILAGSVLVVGEGRALYAGKSYSWFDPDGTKDDQYYIEDIDVSGSRTPYEPIAPKWSSNVTAANASSGSTSSPPSSQTEWAGSAASQSPQTPNGLIDEQWRIAALPCLKIGVKSEGWYHLTQPQLIAAGFDVSADAGNLRMFVGGQELAIRVSRTSGPLGANDYIEFYGIGLDIPTSDTQVYYLVNDSQPGLRITPVGNVTPSASPTPTPLPAPVPSPAPAVKVQPGNQSSQNQAYANSPFWLPSLDSSAASGDSRARTEADEQSTTSATVRTPEVAAVGSFGPEKNTGAGNSRVSRSIANGRADAPASVARKPSAGNQAIPGAARIKTSLRPRHSRHNSFLRTHLKTRRTRGTRKSKLRRNHYHHASAVVVPASTAPNFLYTVQRKDRINYITSLLNGGEVENWFGDVLTSNTHPNQTLTIHNIETSVTGSAQLTVALQGISQVAHQVNVSFNGVALGSMNSSGLDHVVQTFSIPVSSVLEGDNVVQLVPTSSSGASFADYTRLTYPHSLKAFNNTLRLSLRYSQSARIEGFANQNLRILDITDPLAVREVHPVVEISGNGYAAIIPAVSTTQKGLRTLVALPASQLNQPASTVLNQPSTWNQTQAGASLVIISHQNFIGSLAPLVTQRQAQGFSVVPASAGGAVGVINVEDLYDEFSYGVHTPHAITDFLARAKLVWTTAPHYLLLVGDASYDARNYYGAGNFDFVPTMMIDTDFMETCSDDVLADLNGDGIADIPVGRLPARTAAEADLMVSKIVNFSPSNTSPTAVMVADRNDDGYYFSFEQANDSVGNIVQNLSPTTTIQKVYRRLEKTALTGTISANSGNALISGTGTHFLTELQAGNQLNGNGVELGFVSSISGDTSLTLTTNAFATYSGAFGKQSDASANTNIISQINQGVAVVNYSGHGNVDVWRGSLLTAPQARNLTNGNKLPLVVVNDCLNGYFNDPLLEGIAEALLKAPNGGAVASFASSGLTIPDGQHQMAQQLYTLLYGASPITIGDAVIQSKAATFDMDVRRTWILLGDPTLKIR